MTHRFEYYRRLNAVQTEGDWEGRLLFFLDGVATTADEAVASALDLFGIVNRDRAAVLGAGKVTVPALRLFELLTHPVVMIATVVRLLDTTKPTAARAVDAPAKAGVLVETTGRQRDRSFAYERYLDRLKSGRSSGLGGLEGACYGGRAKRVMSRAGRFANWLVDEGSSVKDLHDAGSALSEVAVSAP